MSGRDRAVWDAKQNATRALCDFAGAGVDGGLVDRMASALDVLNKAWDELTDALVAHREERGEEVLRLLNKIADLKAEHERSKR